ncbi:hypothetical protein Hanom_Chr10g00900711 [Helianthus anomalus]
MAAVEHHHGWPSLYPAFSLSKSLSLSPILSLRCRSCVEKMIKRRLGFVEVNRKKKSCLNG